MKVISQLRKIFLSNNDRYENLFLSVCFLDLYISCFGPWICFSGIKKNGIL